MFDAALLEPEANLNSLDCGIMPQTVIDRQSQERPATAIGPRFQKQTKRQTVSPARDSNRDSGRRLERPKPVHQAGKFSDHPDRSSVLGRSAPVSGSRGPTYRSGLRRSGLLSPTPRHPPPISGAV